MKSAQASPIRSAHQEGGAIADSLAGFRAKVQRASEHLDALDASIAPFVTAGDGYSIAREEHAEGAKITYVFRLHVHKTAPFTAWSLLIGDCIHNLRSALDHLFWALLLQRHPEGAVKDSHRAIFPICRDPNTFNGRKCNLENWVHADAFELMERSQPFHFPAPEKHALLFIHECDISDKHKLLLPSVHALHAGAVEFIGSGTFHGSTVTVGPLEHGAEIARAVITPGPQGIVDVKTDETIKVFFMDPAGEWQPASETLRTLVQTVEEVGAEFSPLIRD